MSKLKLDLHPIFSDGEKIEAALNSVFAEAEAKRIPEIEIIPGKGSGALKKTVLRFLNRPEIRSRYHRIDKDADNWGRLFVYFRWPEPAGTPARKPAPAVREYNCFCCDATNRLPSIDETEGPITTECPGCGSPNRITLRRTRSGLVVEAEPGY